MKSISRIPLSCCVLSTLITGAFSLSAQADEKISTADFLVRAG